MKLCTCDHCRSLTVEFDEQHDGHAACRCGEEQSSKTQFNIFIGLELDDFPELMQEQGREREDSVALA